MDYKERIGALDEQIFSQMKLCSYNLECPQFGISFTDQSDKETYRLYKTSEAIVSYFPILSSKKNLLAISLSNKEYAKMVDDIKHSVMLKFFVTELVIVVLSVLFSIFSIQPLRNALNLTEEFIKDILHDFNTPISTLMLNVSMLESEFGSQRKFERIKNSLNTILMLQNNLKAYLNKTIVDDERFMLFETLQERIEMIRRSYKDIDVKTDVPQNIELYTNKDSFVRILDNILSNAFKYNKENGYVHIYMEGKKLVIEDSGVGIKDTKRVFERFYKENQRGIGIGLHIVKKLCRYLGIGIELESREGKGTLFKLDLGRIAKNI